MTDKATNRYRYGSGVLKFFQLTREMENGKVGVLGSSGKKKCYFFYFLIDLDIDKW